MDQFQEKNLNKDSKKLENEVGLDDQKIKLEELFLDNLANAIILVAEDLAKR